MQDRRSFFNSSYLYCLSYFKNKVVWITGASSGIGEALSLALANAGARLILSSRRQEELERVKKACGGGESLLVLPMDLADPTRFPENLHSALDAFGQVDIMIHNGGISQRSLVRDTSMAVQRQVMEVDYFSYIDLTQRLLPHFLERQSGHFVVISSVMGKIGTPLRSAYAAAKHALHGYFDCLRAEVAAQGIHVTLLTPGYIQTNVSRNALTGDGKPLGRVGKNIAEGYPVEKAARQILRAVQSKKYEVYIGRKGKEMMALLINRLFPSILIKSAPRLVPK